MNSGAKMDSYEKNGFDVADEICPDNIVIGPNDMGLLQRLIKASITSNSNSHSKILRQIGVSVDITQGLHWWKQADQYKVGTTTNSQSTMHRLATTPITRDCFEFGDYDPEFDNAITEKWDRDIAFLENLRQKYNETKDKRYWKELIRMLPESWLQTRHWTANYQVLRSAYHDRKNHKLTEWSVDFVNWIKSLPYAEELIMYEG